MRVKDDAKIPRIYFAAVKVVNRYGLEGSSMSKIAEEAGVSAATIYLYFDNKDDMMRKLFLHIKDRMGHSYFSHEMELSPSKATFRKIFLNHYQYIVSNFEEYLFLEDFSTSARISNVEPQFLVDFCPVMESLFDRSKESGLLLSIPNDLIYSLLFAPLTFHLKKNIGKTASMPDTAALMLLFEASWRAIVSR